MTTRRILHAADVHLDSPLQKLDAYDDAPVEQIRGASRRALENLTDLAIERQVDLVVVAGDLYDGDWPDQNTGLFFVKQASRLVRENIPVVVIRGNHDAANKMTSSLPMPKNPDGSQIMLDENRVDLREFDAIGVAVHGRSYRKRAETGDMAGEYPAPLGGRFNLGLLHTGLSGLEGHDPYAPCTPQQLADKEYDYWALGHIHLRGEHQVDGAAPVVFSGNIQGRHIRESGPKGCVIVDVDSRGRCERSFEPLDVVRWQTCCLDASNLSHPDELMDGFEAWLKEAQDEVGDRLLVTRVEVTGDSALHAKLMRSQVALESSLRAIAINQGGGQVWLERLKVRTSPLSIAADESPSAKSFAAEDCMTTDAPLESIHRVVEQLLENSPEESARWIDDEVGDLLKKLPVEFAEESALIDLENQSEVRQWIEVASAELTGRLQGGDR